MFDNTYPTTSQYNGIRHFDLQVHFVPPNHLRGVGKILIKHEMHLKFAAALLHRHEDLRAGSVMVRSNPDADTDICRMRPIKDESCCETLSPCAFYLNSARSFQAFEYHYADDDSVPTEDFLEDLRSFLYAHQLHDVIALTRAPPGRQQWVESLLSDGRGTVARRYIPVKDDFCSATGTITEWTFSK